MLPLAISVRRTLPLKVKAVQILVQMHLPNCSTSLRRSQVSARDARHHVPSARPPPKARQPSSKQVKLYVTVAILAQGTHWAVATSQAFFFCSLSNSFEQSTCYARPKARQPAASRASTSKMCRQREKSWQHPRVFPGGPPP